MEYRIEVTNTEKYCYVNALSNDNERIGKLGIEYKDDKKAKIIYVITNLTACGNGIATAMLNKAIELFNDYELSLNIIPMPREGEKIEFRSIKGLNEFYKKFGFERTSDSSLPTMIRKPSLPTLGE